MVLDVQQRMWVFGGYEPVGPPFGAQVLAWSSIVVLVEKGFGEDFVRFVVVFADSG